MRIGSWMLLMITAVAVPQVSGQVSYRLAAPVPTEKKAWIGVSVTPATHALRHQLKLPEGIGLVVDFVQPKSPADETGLKPYDVLLKLDDQWLVNPEQFAVLARMHTGGDEVHLTFIREGKEQTQAVKLVEHEVPKLPEGDNWQQWLTPPEQLVPPTSPRSPQAHTPGHAMPGGPMNTITFFDGRQQITIVQENAHSTLTVTDPSTGQVVLKSPIDTQEQRDALPTDVRDVLKHLLQYRHQSDDVSNGSDSKKGAATEPSGNR